MKLEYRVKTFRDVGLEAKWSKTRYGAPCIVTRNPSSKSEHQKIKWWLVDNSMWKRAQEVGIMVAFSEHTYLGYMFSISI